MASDTNYNNFSAKPDYPQATIIQPTSFTPGGHPKRDWSVGLCDCCSNPGGAFCALCFSPCYRYQVFTAAGEGLCDCMFGSLVALRTKIRTERNIIGSICGDTCAVIYCGPCVMVQLDSEIKNTPSLI